MNKTFNLFISSISLMAVAGYASDTIRYDNTNHVINPSGKKAYVLNYIEKANDIIYRKLTINIPKLPYKTSFNLCSDVKEVDKCEGSIYVRKDAEGYLLDYNVVFLDAIKDNKAITTKMESEESPVELNEISDEDQIFNYTTLSTHKSHWMLKH